MNLVLSPQILQPNVWYKLYIVSFCVYTYGIPFACWPHTDANDEFHGAIVENRTNLLTGNYASLVLSGNYTFENITKNGKVHSICQKFGKKNC